MTFKEKLQIILLTFFLTIILIFIILNILYLILFEDITYSEKIDIYEKIVITYQNDSEVLKIVERCRNKEGLKGIIHYNTTIECVHYNIPFKYDFNRAKNGPRGVLSPSEIIERKGKGVCRDIAVFRFIALKRLGIETFFIIEPGHIYVIAFEDGEKYELNNQLIIKQ